MGGWQVRSVCGTSTERNSYELMWIFHLRCHYGLWRIRLGHCRLALTFDVYLSPYINTSSCSQYITVQSYFLNSLLRYRYFWDTLYNSTLLLPINRIHLFTYLYFYTIIFWSDCIMIILSDQIPFFKYDATIYLFNL